MLLKIHPDNPQLKKLEKAISILKDEKVLNQPKKPIVNYN